MKVRKLIEMLAKHEDWNAEIRMNVGLPLHKNEADPIKSITSFMFKGRSFVNLNSFGLKRK